VLRLDIGNAEWEIRISQPFVVAAPDGTDQLVVPEELAHVEAVLALLRLAVEEATAYKDGRLELRLAGGTMLQVPPDEGYEAWAAAGPDGMKVFALPVGELAVWRSTADPGE
jgi:hypothetical protein